MSPSRHMRPIAAAGALVLAALTGGIPAMADTDPQDGSTSATTDEPTTQESTDTAPPAEGDNQDPDALTEGGEGPAGEEGSAGEEGTAGDGEVSEGAGEPTAQEEEPALTSKAADGEISALAVPAGATVNVLNITDFHGRIEASRESAGAAVLACAIDGWENPVFTSSGDNIGASTFVSASQLDQPTIDVLNAMGLAVSAVGNHELDRGWEWFSDDVLGNDVSSTYRPAEFPYLAANLVGESPELPGFEVVDVDGVRVGFVGAVTEDLLSLVSSAGIAGITVGPIVSNVNRVAADLLDGDVDNGEADVVIALIHEGAGSADDLGAFEAIAAGLSSDVTAAFGGHTHVAFAGEAASGLTVVQAAQYGERLGRIELTFSGDGVEVTAAEVIDMVDSSQKDAGGKTIYDPYCEGDPDIQAIVDDAVAEAEIVGSVPVGFIGADFNRAQNSDGSENRGGESTLGNLIADAQLWGTRELNTELAFMNSGGIRTDLEYEGTAEPVTNEDGVVTFQEAAEVQPFANTLVAMDLTGAQVLEALEQQWRDDAFLKLGVAGLTYEYDPTAPAGERITKVMLDSGEDFDEAATYRIVVNSFLAPGGDDFFAFADGVNRADSGRIDLDVFVSYIGEFGTEASPLMPDYDQRAIGVVDVNGNGDAIESGQEIAIDLSSLLFSTNEPKAENVVVTFDGAVLGTFPIDPTIVDDTDEVGRAQVRVTIPDLDGYDKGEMVTLAVHLDTADGDTVLEWTYEMEGSEDGGTTPPLPDTGAEVADLGLMASALLFMGVAGLIARRRMTALQ